MFADSFCLFVEENKPFDELFIENSLTSTCKIKRKNGRRSEYIANMGSHWKTKF
jgi:hypothetical protein